MLLTLTTTHRPATDLGYLLHKNPVSAQTFELGFGNAHIFFPEATDDRCTAALLLDIDPVGLVRGKTQSVFQYVNDRPYVASSFMSVALNRVFRTAMTGASKERQELADTAIPLIAEIPVLPCRGGEAFVRALFEPLGYEVALERLPLDTQFPEWGESRYCSMRLSATVRLADLLNHLYVLIPALDSEKHYFIADEEVAKLVRKGGAWLAAHPLKDAIVRRYLKNQHSLVRDALDQLTIDEAPVDDDQEDGPPIDETELAATSENRKPSDLARTSENPKSKIQNPKSRTSLHDLRLEAALAAVKQSGAKTILDLGCGEGRLIQLLMKEKQFLKIVGVDVAYRVLEMAHRRLRTDRMPPTQRERLSLIQGSLIYRDERLAGFDAAAVVEVIEHLDPPRLAAFERSVFEFARPTTVVITTPNIEYNPLFETLPENSLRHRDHRFEWTRAEFRAWADHVCDRFAYEVRLLPVGPEDAERGAPSQMAIFTRAATVGSEEAHP